MVEMSEEWCREQLAKLQIKDQRCGTLNEIRDQLTSMPAHELAVTSNFLQLPALFDCLDDTSNEQTNLACDILSMCMANLELGRTITNHGNLVTRALNHSNPGVKMLGLEEISRVMARSPPAALNDTQMVLGVVSCLECEDTSIGTKAVHILEHLLLAWVSVAIVRQKIEHTLSCNDVIRCRTYELAVKIASTSVGNLQAVQFILNRLVAELDNSDVLIQLNILELLSQLAASASGVTYLEQIDVLGKIAAMAVNIDENPVAGILLPGLLKFFGRIASAHPVMIFNDYPLIVMFVLNSVKERDFTLTRCAALDALSSLASTSESKLLLAANYDPQMHQALFEIGSFLHNLPTDLKVLSINCLGRMFQSDCEPPNNQISSIVENWFKSFAGAATDLEMIRQMCVNPFPDIKLAGLQFLTAIVSYYWGQQLVGRTAGFVEYLLDRKTENANDARHAKYGIIVKLSRSPAVSQELQMEMRTYISQGVFYVETFVEVAVEGE